MATGYHARQHIASISLLFTWLQYAGQNKPLGKWNCLSELIFQDFEGLKPVRNFGLIVTINQAPAGQGAAQAEQEESERAVVGLTSADAGSRGSSEAAQ
jgi:hypothetical protein